jgi:hypothetical protein
MLAEVTYYQVLIAMYYFLSLATEEKVFESIEDFISFNLMLERCLLKVGNQN